jgi:alpha-tubulin suppressor-like RCC1 family protein
VNSIRLVLAIAVLAAALSFLGCRGNSGTQQCRSAADCFIGETCQLGRCIDEAFDASSDTTDLPDVDDGDPDQTDDIEDVPTVEPDPVMALSSGTEHTCALLESGRVRCWGDNSSNQLGPEHSSFESSAVPVSIAHPLRHIASGARHTCAIRRSGTVLCWGFNHSGQLGAGNTEASIHRVDEVRGLPLDQVQNLAAGCSHTCALLQSGEVSCWGSNTNFNLGTRDPQLTDPQPPTIVPDLDDARFIAAGCDHSCAIVSDGIVMCWGLNSEGQLGNNQTTSPMGPTMVFGLTDIKKVALGRSHSCALSDSGNVSCWGDNSNAQLGRDNMSSSNIPVSVHGLSKVLDIWAGFEHTCALLLDGNVACWGSNYSGELGQTQIGNPMAEPVAVRDLGGFASDLAAGEGHSCAIVGEDVLCWGKNDKGQAGSEIRTMPRLTPGPVSGLR